LKHQGNGRIIALPSKGQFLKELEDAAARGIMKKAFQGC
jgi:hypothetical protein